METVDLGASGTADGAGGDDMWGGFGKKKKGGKKGKVRLSFTVSLTFKRSPALLFPPKGTCRPLQVLWCMEIHLGQLDWTSHFESSPGKLTCQRSPANAHLPRLAWQSSPSHTLEGGASPTVICARAHPGQRIQPHGLLHCRDSILIWLRKADGKADVACAGMRNGCMNSSCSRPLCMLHHSFHSWTQ